MLNNAYIGIDPGKSGAIAILYNTNRIEVTNMIMGGKELDIPKMADWIYDRVSGVDNVVACIEKVHSMPNQGVKSTFTFGFNYGILHAIISTMLIPLYIIPPAYWQKEILKHTTKDKQDAIDFVLRVYPNLSLLATPRSRKPHSGMADAICIARYAYEKYLR